jgi:hypothetical protein
MFATWRFVMSTLSVRNQQYDNSEYRIVLALLPPAGTLEVFLAFACVLRLLCVKHCILRHISPGDRAARSSSGGFITAYGSEDWEFESLRVRRRVFMGNQEKAPLRKAGLFASRSPAVKAYNGSRYRTIKWGQLSPSPLYSLKP